MRGQKVYPLLKDAPADTLRDLLYCTPNTIYGERTDFQHVPAVGVDYLVITFDNKQTDRHNDLDKEVEFSAAILNIPNVIM